MCSSFGSLALEKASIARSVGVKQSLIPTVISNGVGEMRWMLAAGLYPRNASIDLTVTSFFHSLFLAHAVKNS